MQVLFEFNIEKNKIEKNVQFIRSAFGPILANDLWNLNTIELEDHLSAVLQVDYVGYASIHDSTVKTSFSKGVKPHSGNSIKSSIPIQYFDGVKDIQLGNLEVHFDLNKIYGVLFERFGVTVVSNFIKTLIIILVIFMVFERVLTRHLRKIAFFLKNDAFTSFTKRLELDRKPTSKKIQDELGMLEDSVNAFLGQLEKARKDLTNEYSQKQIMQKKALEMAHFAGVAKYSNGVLHNVRNVMMIAEGSLRQLNRNKEEESIQFANDRMERAFLKLSESVTIATNLIRVQQDSQQSSYTDLQFVNVQDFIKSCVELMEYTLKKYSVQVNVGINKEMKIFTSPSKLVNIFINLIKNACEAMENTLLENRKIWITAREFDQYIALSIEDSGMGFDEATKKKIFSFGFSTKKLGHGFGMHSCKEIMVNLKGDLTMASPGFGLGAIATLKIPIASDVFEEEDKPLPTLSAS